MVDMNRDIWLMRHGATEFSEAGRYCGHTDAPLSSKGRRQARSTRSNVTKIAYQHLWSSDLRRCVETARLATGQEPVIDNRIREFDFGRIEGMRFDDLTLDLQNGLITFDDFAAPGGETAAVFRARIKPFLDGLPAGRHLVVTHGGVIRLILRQTGNDGSVAPGDLIHIAAGNDGLKVRDWPQEMR